MMMMLLLAKFLCRWAFIIAFDVAHEIFILAAYNKTKLNDVQWFC